MERKEGGRGTMEGSIRCSANYVPLSPLSFLERAAIVYADRTSVIYGSTTYTWKQTRDRCLRLASALSALGISRHDVVAVLAANVPAMYELHFAVPMAGAVLCTLNTRHDSAMVSVLLKHSEAKIFFVDSHLLEFGQGAVKLLSESNVIPPTMIIISDFNDSIPAVRGVHMSVNADYESLLQTAPPNFEIKWPNDECDPIS
ncbi:unnamed protein product, partial [Musa textilis]